MSSLSKGDRRKCKHILEKAVEQIREETNIDPVEMSMLLLSGSVSMLIMLFGKDRLSEIKTMIPQIINDQVSSLVNDEELISRYIKANEEEEEDDGDEFKASW